MVSLKSGIKQRMEQAAQEFPIIYSRRLAAVSPFFFLEPFQQAIFYTATFNAFLIPTFFATRRAYWLRKFSTATEEEPLDSGESDSTSPRQTQAPWKRTFVHGPQLASMAVERRLPTSQRSSGSEPPSTSAGVVSQRLPTPCPRPLTLQPSADTPTLRRLSTLQRRLPTPQQRLLTLPHLPLVYPPNKYKISVFYVQRLNILQPILYPWMLSSVWLHCLACSGLCAVCFYLGLL